jgi:uncharacterized membrane protein
MQPTEAAGPEPPGSRLYMDAVIWPNRSLSPRGLTVLLCVFTVYNIVVAVFLLLIGAFPIPLFLGLDVLGLALAFHFSNRRTRDAERVQVSAEAVRVVRQDRGRPLTVWTSPTAFTRVAVEVGEDEAEVKLELSGRSLAIAQALSPAERADFAAALQRAIREARQERY